MWIRGEMRGRNEHAYMHIYIHERRHMEDTWMRFITVAKISECIILGDLRMWCLRFGVMIRRSGASDEEEAGREEGKGLGKESGDIPRGTA